MEHSLIWKAVWRLLPAGTIQSIRADELFDPGHGRIIKEWVAIAGVFRSPRGRLASIIGDHRP